MHKQITQPSLATVSFALILFLFGCTGGFPTHDGSLNTVYGIDQPDRELATVVKPDVKKQLEESVYTPEVQTISSPDVIHSSPITRIEQFNEPVRTASAEDQQSADEAPQHKAHHHVLGAGETLYSIASQFTGSSTNWKKIADYNGIENPDAMLVGDEVLIPLDLVILESGNNKDSASYALVSPVQTALDEAVKETTNPETRPSPTVISATEIVIHSDENIPEINSSTETIQAEYIQDQTPEKQATHAQDFEPVAENDISTSENTPAIRTKDAVSSSEKPSIDPPSPPSLRERLSNFASLIKTGFKRPSSSQREETSVTPTPAANTQDSPRETVDMASLDIVEKDSVDKDPGNSVQQSRPEQAPTLDATSAENNGSPRALKPVKRIQIDGNFTPKAIYKGAGYESGLLMRVAPGTTFELMSQKDDWYEVETDKGMGYVFHRDALLIQ